MTDMTLPTFDEFPPEFGDPDAGLGQGIDFSTVDQTFQTISHIESTWDMPAIPDVVKVDLMANQQLLGMPVGDFLNGIVSDMTVPDVVSFGQTNPVALTTASQFGLDAAGPMVGTLPGMELPGGFVDSTRETYDRVKASFTTDARLQAEGAFINDFRKLFASVGNPGERSPEQRPWVVPQNGSVAVMELQQQAIDAGILPPDTKVNGIWTPELRSARYQLLNQQANREMAGDRPGAMSVAGMGRLLDEWTSPSGLLVAAVTLDYVPDFDRIAEEYNSWGDRLREWKDDFWNPRKAVAALGPIDDIALPVFNTYLLLSGFGGAGLFATRLMRGMQAGASYGKWGSRFMQSANFGVRKAGLAQPGFLATKGLNARQGSALFKTADQMAKWRQYRGVMIGKRTIQEGMKLGLASQFESTVFQTGRNDDRYTEWLNKRTDNPIAMAAVPMFELALSPSSIMAPGRVTSVYKGAKGSVTKRVMEFADAGMEGDWAHKLVPWRIQRMATDGSPVYDLAGARALEKIAPKNPEKALAAIFDPDLLDELKKTGDVVLTDEARVKIGEQLYRAVAEAALDKHSTSWVQALNIEPDDPILTGATEIDDIIRNKMIAQIRGVPEPPDTLINPESFNPGDEDHRLWLFDILERKLAIDVVNIPDEGTFGYEQYQKILKNRNALKARMLDDALGDDLAKREAVIEELFGDATRHMEERAAFADDMFAHTNGDDLVNYVSRHPDILDRAAHHDEYVSGTIALKEWGDVRRGKSPTYWDPDADIDEIVRTTRANFWGDLDMPDYVPSEIEDELNHMLRYEIRGQIGENRLRVFDFDIPIDRLSGRLGLMRTDTVDKQQATKMLAYLKMYRGRQKLLERAGETALSESELWNIYGQHITARPGWWRIGPDTLKTIYKQMKRGTVTGTPVDQAFQVSPDSFVEYVKALRDADRAGVADLSTGVSTHVLQRLDQVKTNEKFWTSVGISPIGKTADDLIDELGKRLPRIAASVTVDDPMLAAKFVDSGYKPVIMVEGLMPADMVGLTSPLGDIDAAKLARQSLGTFLTRQDTMELNRIRARQLRMLIRDKLQAVGSEKLLDPDHPFTDTEVEDIIRLLERQVQEKNILINKGDRMAGRGGEKMARKATSQLNSASIRQMSNDEVRQALNGSNRLGEAAPYAEVSERFGGWTEAEVKAIHGALAESDILGFKYRGIAHLEDALVGKSPIMSWLHSMEGTEVGDEIKGFRRAWQMMQRKEPTGYVGIEYWDNYKRAANVAVGAGLGAAMAMNEDFDFEGAALAAAAGGVANSMFKGKAVSTRTVSALTAGFFSSAVLDAVTDNRGLSGTAGLALGIGAFAASPQLARKGVQMMNGRAWGQYSALGEGYVRLRNAARFSLSPIFDLQRYTEGLTMGQAREGKILKARFNPAKYIAKSDEFEFNTVGELVEAYHQALRTKYGKVADIAEAMQDTGSEYWMERGILGFSAVEQEAAVWAQLTNAGVDSAEAIDRARRVFTYGSQARSGLEQSMNFVFFPFSFQKKFLTDVGEFMAKDLTRLAVVHNSLRMFQEMDERHDLGKFFEERVPFMKQLRDVNPLAYGLSVGRMGGINAPLVQTVMESSVTRAGIDPVMNLFLPQALSIGEPEEALALGTFANQTFAAVRDFGQLVDDTRQQARVISSESHLTSWAEETYGWEKYSDVRNTFADRAERVGLNWTDVTRADADDGYAWALRLEYENEVRKMRDMYPAWRESYNRSIANRAEKGLELRLTINAAQTNAERRFAQFHNAVIEAEQRTREVYGVSLLDDPALAPPRLQAELREQAARIAGADDEFHRLYRRYYESDLGPIQRGL